MKKRLVRILGFTMMVLLVVSSVSFAAFWNSKPLIVTTIYPLYDFTKQIVGDKADIVLLVPPGAEPHDWEPAPTDILTIKKATVFIYNGAGMEGWVDKLDSSVLADKKVVKASDFVNVMTAQFTEEGEPSTDGSVDPHIWLDPVNAQAIVSGITNALAAADSDNAEFYTNNSNNYIAQLEELNQEYSQALSQASSKQFVTSHAAFGYMAQRYGLQQIAIMGLSPDAEPTPARMAEIIQHVKDNQIKYIFFETLISPKLSEVIASESNAQTLVLNPIEGLTDQESAAGANYISEMRMNLTNLKYALGIAQ
jgi:zinc transport system substrate-binding protein